MKEVTRNGIKVRYGKITVTGVAKHKYKEGIFQAELKQEVTTIYPSQRIGNSEADNLFSESDFNIEDGKTYTSTRVTWINVPKGSKVADIQKRINALTNPTLMRKISYNVKDVMTAEQIQACESDALDIDFDKFEDTLRVRDAQGNDIPGEPQYRQYFFKQSFVEDVEFRDEVPTTVRTNRKAELEA
jgi:hypothetical protein